MRPLSPARSPEMAPSCNSILFTTWGVSIRHFDGAQAVADANQVLFSNANVSYRIEHPGAIGEDSLVFSYPESVIADAIRPWDPSVDDRRGRVFDRPAAPANQEIYLQQRALAISLGRVQDIDRGEIAENALLLLADVVEADYGSRCGKAAAAGETLLVHREVAEGVKVLLSPWSMDAKPPRLETLAATIGYSPFYLCRMFKAHCGETIHRYLERLRLRAALELILETRQDIGSIGVELGYSSHSHFTLAFRRQFGMLPSRLRANPGLLTGDVIFTRRQGGAIGAILAKTQAYEAIAENLDPTPRLR